MDINIQRAEAAEQTGGGSPDYIHDLAARIIAERGLRGDVLDYGAGMGAMSLRLARANSFTSITAADLLRWNDDPSINYVLADMNGPLPLPDSSFDLIVSLEVIEHLENPRATIREWFRLLRPDGTLIFSTPNNESWRAILSLILRDHFIMFTGDMYPAHITALLRLDIERILTASGFTSIEFIYSDRGCIPKFPAKDWQDISKTFKGRRYSDNVIVIASRPTERQGALVEVAQRDVAD